MSRLTMILVGAGACAGATALLVVAPSCAPSDEVLYGNPNTLARANLPGDGGGIVELVCGGGDGGSDAGKTFDGGCPSFEADIYPYFAPAGPWHCGDAKCHGGASDPAIDTSAADKCLAALQAAKIGGVAYVSTDGGKDPAASSILCNLQGTCGKQMPEPPGTQPTNDDLCTIQQWLACGAKP